jgi:hypothetical protein
MQTGKYIFYDVTCWESEFGKAKFYQRGKRFRECQPNWHLTLDGATTLCGVESNKRIHVHYADRELDLGQKCKDCMERLK